MAASRTDAPEALRAEALSKSYGDPPRAPGRLVQRRAGRAARDHRARTAPARRRCCRSSPARSRRQRAACRSTAATSAGCRSSPRSTRSSRCARTCACSRGWRRSPTSTAAVERMLAQAGLDDRAGDPVGTLSGGNQQRVNVAVGLLGDPSVLLLDEPSSSLDPRQRERLWEFVSALARDGGTTVVYSTHNVAEAERYADRLLVLADGELLFTGTPDGARARDRRARRDRLRGRVRALPAQPGALTCAGCCSRTCRSCAARRCSSRCSCSIRSSSRCSSAPRSRPARRSRGRVRQPRAARRGDDRPRRPAARRHDLRVRAVRRGRPDPRRLARGGDRQGPRPARRSARS